MKNIHLIPTDKPSRLLMSKRNNLQFLKDNSSLNPNNHFEGTYKNIYITSDKSPNINGYYLLNDNVVCKKDETYFATSWTEREIILTTNIELIADGVQAIDDEFLEWFVKNPSCEEVVVEKILLGKVEGTTMLISKYKTLFTK